MVFNGRPFNDLATPIKVFFNIPFLASRYFLLRRAWIAYIMLNRASTHRLFLSVCKLLHVNICIFTLNLHLSTYLY